MRRTVQCFAAGLLCTGVCLLVAGCVERTLVIRSEPSGARVVVNGRPAGVTPVTFPFETYGTFEVVARLRGHHRLRAEVPAKAPWYEHIPMDYFVESLWPFTVHDVHEVTLSLKPLGSADDDRIDRREEEIRGRLQTDK